MKIAEACMVLDVPFFWRHRGTMLVNGRGAGRVVEYLHAQGQRVLGLEGFEFESTVIHPRLDRIYDADRTRVDAETVLSGWEPEVWVDIFLDSDAAAADALRGGGSAK
jgi:hypothetical protein